VDLPDVNIEVYGDDAGAFWDFMSVHQEERTDSQQVLFKAAMQGMRIVFCHDAILVLKMMKMPSCPQPLSDTGLWNTMVNGERRTLAWDYSDRGWPWFESNIANIRGVHSMSRLEFYKDIIKLDGMDDILKCVTQGAPMHPDRFEKTLSLKVF